MQNAFHRVLDEFALRYKSETIDVVAGTEARGFIFGTALAVSIRCRFCPYPKKKANYLMIRTKPLMSLEYGSDTLEIHQRRVSETQQDPVMRWIS